MDRTLIAAGTLLILYGLSSTVLAQSSSSPNYQLDETFIGPGGSIESNSPNYQTQSTLGDTAAGQADSTTYGAAAGFNTTSEPRLSMVVNTSSINFGAFSTSTATTATSTFSVLNYTSYGYAVFTVGNPPSNDGHTLAGISPAAASAAGTEQFGMNLKANTSPVTFGAEPTQVPSGSFSYGSASSGYNTANNFRYGAGEQIAGATRTSGQTDYTISYIVNISSTTPGGQYGGNQALVVVGTY